MWLFSSMLSLESVAIVWKLPTFDTNKEKVNVDDCMLCFSVKISFETAENINFWFCNIDLHQCFFETFGQLIWFYKNIMSQEKKTSKVADPEKQNVILD